MRRVYGIRDEPLQNIRESLHEMERFLNAGMTKNLSRNTARGDDTAGPVIEVVKAGILLFRGSFKLAGKIASKVRFEVPGETKRKRSRVEIMTSVEFIIDDRMTEFFLGLFSWNPSGKLYGIYKDHIVCHFCIRINPKTGKRLTLGSLKPLPLVRAELHKYRLHES